VENNGAPCRRPRRHITLEVASTADMGRRGARERRLGKGLERHPAYAQHQTIWNARGPPDNSKAVARPSAFPLRKEGDQRRYETNILPDDGYVVTRVVVCRNRRDSDGRSTVRAEFVSGTRIRPCRHLLYLEWRLAPDSVLRRRRGGRGETAKVGVGRLINPEGRVPKSTDSRRFLIADRKTCVECSVSGEMLS